jgi:DNA-directed RNA polymerase specialized sigma24 family protein
MAVRHFEADVHRWVLRIVRDTGAANDVLVGTFWRAYRRRARYDPSRAFGAWVESRPTRRWIIYGRCAAIPRRRRRSIPLRRPTGRTRT